MWGNLSRTEDHGSLLINLHKAEKSLSYKHAINTSNFHLTHLLMKVSVRYSKENPKNRNLTRPSRMLE